MEIPIRFLEDDESKVIRRGSRKVWAGERCPAELASRLEGRGRFRCGNARARWNISAFAENLHARVDTQAMPPGGIAYRVYEPRLPFRDPKAILKFVDPSCDCPHQIPSC